MMSLQKVEQYADRLTEDQSKKACEGTQGKNQELSFRIKSQGGNGGTREKLR